MKSKSEKNNINKMVIVVDTREQLPYLFKKYDYEIIKKGLDSGDYSILNHENEITIERKSKEDLYGCIGNGRERFERELQRLRKYNRSCVVIESSISDFVNNAPLYTKVSPLAAIRSCFSWYIKYNVPFLFCENRDIAENTTRNLLELYYKHSIESKNNTKIFVQL